MLFVRQFVRSVVSSSQSFSWSSYIQLELKYFVLLNYVSNIRILQTQQNKSDLFHSSSPQFYFMFHLINFE